MSTPFRFKQFSVAHDRCAHKVGTDGTLLGAWATAENPKRILDIGTGSGLIALMLAQRFTEATVIGIEFDLPSAEQAKENAANSPFHKRIEIEHGDFLHHKFSTQFDLVVSNPPFYKGNTSTGKSERDRARHEEFLPQLDFIQKTKTLLSQKGKLAVILPKEESEAFIEIARSEGLYLAKRTRVFGSPNVLDKRWLLEFSFRENEPVEDKLTIRDLLGERSEAYKYLTKDFYL